MKKLEENLFEVRERLRKRSSLSLGFVLADEL